MVRVHGWCKTNETSKAALTSIVEILSQLGDASNSSNVTSVVSQLLCNLRGVPIRDESLKSLGIRDGGSKSSDNCGNQFVRILRCYLETWIEIYFFSLFFPVLFFMYLIDSSRRR